MPFIYIISKTLVHDPDWDTLVSDFKQLSEEALNRQPVRIEYDDGKNINIMLVTLEYVKINDHNKLINRLKDEKEYDWETIFALNNDKPDVMCILNPAYKIYILGDAKKYLNVENSDWKIIKVIKKLFN